MSLPRRSPWVYYSSRYLAKLWSWVWLRFRTYGREHVPRTGAFVLVSNHQSALDPILLGLGAGSRVRFVARASLSRFRPLGWWLRSVGTLLIDREAPSRQSMERIVATLAAGIPVVFFPEGTRSRDGRIGSFRRGLLLLLERTGVPVLPAGLRGTGAALQRGRVFPRPTACAMLIGVPVPASEVLAPGGLERLRAVVSQLAGVPSDRVGAGQTPVLADDKDSSARRS